VYEIMSSWRCLQLTLAALKPDVVSRPHVSSQIKTIILENNFYFVRSKQLTLSRNQAADFYKEHDGRFFHNRLVSFMSSGPISVHVLARHEAIPEWRRLLGPTKVLRTIYEHPDTIRGQFGLTDTRNCAHGSDSDDTARREIEFFFPDFDPKQWFADEEAYFRAGHVTYDADRQAHTVDLIMSDGRTFLEKMYLDNDDADADWT
jgi:nucleoside-diphosphate kinase